MKISDSSMRLVHLLTGAFCTAFLLMYGVSAVQMSHTGWFYLGQTVTEQDVTVDGGTVQTARALGLMLMRDHGMTGEIRSVEQAAGDVRLQIARPGAIYDVTYRQGADTAHVRTSVAELLGVLNRIHHISGLRHELGVLNAWGLMVGVISLGLLVLGISGLWLWFRIHDERVVGGAILAAGLVVGLGLMVLTRMQA